MDPLLKKLGEQVGPWSGHEILVALGVIVGAFVVRTLFQRWVARRLLALAERTRTEADDVAVHALITPLGWVLPLLGIYVAFRLLAAGDVAVATAGGRIFMVAMTVIVAWTLFRFVDALSIFVLEYSRRTETTLDDALVPTVRKAIKVFLGVLITLIMIQNLGYSVTGILGALGVGGVAVALGAKDTFANLFGSATILIDRPFRPNDWITLDGADGVVEEVGLRSTRIRTFAKTVISIPNWVLANATVENHSLMPKRRVRFTVGVTYDASPAQMREAVQRIEAYLRGNAEIHQEFMLVKFTEFGASSLDILVYCFTVTTDWERHLQLRQDMNLAVMDIVADLGLSIAFPTRTVHLVNEEPAPSA